MINKFIDLQAKKNPDFEIEVFIEPNQPKTFNNPRFVEGTVNLVISKSKLKNTKEVNNHGASNVLSLNASMIMTGFCLSNNKAKANSSFYNDIATSNMMGAWGFMDEAISGLWWITPTDWDRIDAKTKKLYVENYLQHKESEINNE